ncbi:uncharacterized protein G2W53_005124 [Senna tora]|uniref:Uncharacterized protein n=1 Tax=Senna tora TaxID=362788 RepID=A0A834XF42_9FABA|nr:uncharacterized protein G2W53_005124 [Senna tora]
MVIRNLLRPPPKPSRGDSRPPEISPVPESSLEPSTIEYVLCACHQCRQMVFQLCFPGDAGKLDNSGLKEVLKHQQVQDSVCNGSSVFRRAHCKPYGYKVRIKASNYPRFLKLFTIGAYVVQGCGVGKRGRFIELGSHFGADVSQFVLIGGEYKVSGEAVGIVAS